MPSYIRTCREWVGCVLVCVVILCVYVRRYLRRTAKVSALCTHPAREPR
jgi:hypothetical protein